MSNIDGIVFSDIHVSFDGSAVLKWISSRIPQWEIVSIVWPSGSWKTTLLSVLNGLLTPDKWQVIIDGKVITDVADNVWIVFQDYSLFPWLSVIQNIAFGKSVQNLEKKQRDKKLKTILQKIWLWEQRDKFPHQLSGWMQQRVSIWRTIANDSEYIFMDEPFGALDYQTKLKMHDFVLKIWKELWKTIVIITHNIDEAILISDRILMLPLQKGKDIEEIQVTMSRPRLLSDPNFEPYKEKILNYLEKEVTF